MNKNQFQSYTNNNTTRSARLNFKRSYCAHHPDEVLNYYCFDDNCLVCAECIISGQFRNKDCLKLSKAFPKIKSRLNEIYDINVNSLRSIDIYKNKTADQINTIQTYSDVSKSKAIERINFLKDKLDSMYYNFESNLNENSGMEVS